MVAGTSTMAAIKTDGTLWAWGHNQHGQIGQGNRTYYSSPKQIPGTTWVNIRPAGHVGWIMTKTDGSLWGVGRNLEGQLGQNNRTQYSSPVKIGNNSNWTLEGVGYSSQQGTAGTPMAYQTINSGNAP